MAFDDSYEMVSVFGSALIEIMSLTDVNCDEAPLMARRALDRSGFGGQSLKYKALKDHIDMIEAKK